MASPWRESDGESDGESGGESWRGAGGAGFGRSAAGQRSPWRPPSAVRALLALNLGAFLACFLTFLVSTGAWVAVVRWLGVGAEAWRAGVPALWQLGSYAFLHDVSELFHVLGNMLVLYFFGTQVERAVGTRRLLVLYAGAAVLGGAVYLGLQLLLGTSGPAIGASGACLALLVAAATLAPEQRVFLFPLPITLTLRTLALGWLAIQVFHALLSLKQGGDGTAYSIHFAGMAYGFVAVKSGLVWRDPWAWWASWRVARAAQSSRSDERRLDELLARIAAKGLASLSQAEKEFLRRMSRR
jgi:membrane associated rhomboid family serine protease